MHKRGLGMGSVLEVIAVLQEPFPSSLFISAHPNSTQPKRPSGTTGKVRSGQPSPCPTACKRDGSEGWMVHLHPGLCPSHPFLHHMSRCTDNTIKVLHTFRVTEV